MKIIETGDYDDLSRKSAGIVLAQVKAKPSSLLVLPTGNTPLGLFRELVKAAKSGAANFGQVAFVTLDEYADIASDDRRRLSSWLSRELLTPLGIAADAFHAFDPRGNPGAEAERIEGVIAARGGIDLAVLGLGPNGHLGFNEPGSPFDSRTRLVSLTPESIRSNAAYWGGEVDVPSTAYTLGLGTINECRSVVLVVSGARKAGILARTLNDAVSINVPATLFRVHPSSIVIADRDALAFAG